MKNIVILSICILIFGCSKTDKKTLIISGVSKDAGVTIAMLKTLDSTYIDTIENGNFSFKINELNSNYIDLKLNSWIPLFGGFNDSICIEYENKDKISFSGIGYEESQFLEYKRNLIKELGFDDPRMIDINLFSAKPDMFITKIDSIKLIRINHLNEYRKLHPNISENLYDTESQLINYYWINQQFGYPRFHEMLTKNKPDLSDNYYKFAEQIETNNTKLFSFNVYKSTLRSYLSFKAIEFNEKYTIAKEMFTDRAIFEDLMFREFNSYMNFNGVDGIDSICMEFMQSLSDPKQKESLKTKYQGWSKLAKGKKAPDFEIKDDKGDLVRLSDQQGKFVYIDCWSSYCGPCIAEMPAMNKLSEDLKGNNIVFISISADKDIKRWLVKLKEYNMNSINLCTEGSRHKFNNDYNAKAFPRYILIDDKGIIIDATANKPSMIKEELEQLL